MWCLPVTATNLAPNRNLHFQQVGYRILCTPVQNLLATGPFQIPQARHPAVFGRPVVLINSYGTKLGEIHKYGIVAVENAGLE